MINNWINNKKKNYKLLNNGNQEYKNMKAKI